ncbi:hypothetical protein VTP01DRAFT_2343 [Rhizomucor pusillus]|uniref:uncharacterized protein n=1 Tax=Rhizomucor pusillus TaxID=4840 RepID=UPI003743E634
MSGQKKSASPATPSDQEQIITQLTLAGFKVLILRKGDQMIYKLPDDTSLSSVSPEKKEKLEAEIKTLHAALLAATLRNAPGASSQSENSNAVAAAAAAAAKAIAPKQNGITAPFPVAGRAADANAIVLATQQLREDLESSQRSTPEVKTTRKYVKTGKYSKKRLQQQQQQQQQQPQPQAQQAQPTVTQLQHAQVPSQQQAQNQQILAQQQLLALQQSLQAAQNAAGPAPASQPPLPFNQTLSKTILSKRLPEEEAHHLEIKKRFTEAIKRDRDAATAPDYVTPFKSKKDVIERLLPFHIYQYPEADLEFNRFPEEQRRESTLEIFKSQVELFEKFAKTNEKLQKSGNSKQLRIMLERQCLADLRQKLTEEQARVASEQAAMQHQEILKLQAAAMLSDAQRQQQANTGSPNAQSAQNIAATLAQATALLQNPQLASQYNQLSPELQQQLIRNKDQLAALFRQHASPR